MKKSSFSKILLASLSIFILNSCSKSNVISTSDSIPDSTSIRTPLPQPFELAYVISPLTSDIISITFNDENGNPKTVYGWGAFPDGIIEMKVSADAFKAKISAIVHNQTSHPVGFHLEIRVNGLTEQIRDFTIPTMTYANESAEYDVQLK